MSRTITTSITLTISKNEVRRLVALVLPIEVHPQSFSFSDYFIKKLSLLCVFFFGLMKGNKRWIAGFLEACQLTFFLPRQQSLQNSFLGKTQITDF